MIEVVEVQRPHINHVNAVLEVSDGYAAITPANDEQVKVTVSLLSSMTSIHRHILGPIGAVQPVIAVVSEQVIAGGAIQSVVASACPVYIVITAAAQGIVAVTA